MFHACVLAVAAFVPPAAGSGRSAEAFHGRDRFAWAEVEVQAQGENLPAALWSAVDGSTTRVEGKLLPGEVRRLMIPMPCPGPELLLEKPERGAFSVAWRTHDPSGRFGALPSLLRLRSPPALLGSGPAPPLSTLLALALVFVATACCSRRPLSALAVSILGSALVAWMAKAQAPPSTARILEGDGGSGEWLALTSALSRLELIAREPLRLATRPELAPIHWSVSLEDSSRWTLGSPGATLLWYEEFNPGSRQITGALNAFGTLESAWRRAPNGRWSDHGRWELGRELPHPREEGSPPPGWLAANLPPGLEVLCGMLASAPGDKPRQSTWLRIVDWRP